MVKNFFKEKGLKVAVRFINVIPIGEDQRVNEYEITMLNLKIWRGIQIF